MVAIEFVDTSLDSGMNFELLEWGVDMSFCLRASERPRLIMIIAYDDLPLVQIK